MNTVVFTLELEKGADVGLIEKMIKDMKGVLKARLSRNASYHKGMDAATWYEGVEAMRKGYDPSAIDLDDERTRYLLSK